MQKTYIHMCVLLNSLRYRELIFIQMICLMIVIRQVSRLFKQINNNLKKLKEDTVRMVFITMMYVLVISF